MYADELKESSRFYRGIEGGVEGPLEASRGAKVEWASIWRTLNRLFISSWPRTGGSKPQQRGLTKVLHRPVEIATHSGLSSVAGECLIFGVSTAAITADGTSSAWEAEVLPLKYARFPSNTHRFYSRTV